MRQTCSISLLLLSFDLVFKTTICIRNNENVLFYNGDDEWVLRDRYRGFGCSIDMDNEFLVIGSCRDNVDNKLRAGSVSIFKRNAIIFNFASKITVPDQQANDFFGYAVSVYNRILIASSLYHSEKYTEHGAVYVLSLEYIKVNWELEQKLLPIDSKPSYRFGRAVGIFKNVIVVGASQDNEMGETSGVVYVFSRNSVKWIQITKLYSLKSSTNDNFGVSLNVYEDVVLVGAPWYGTGRFIRSGCVYVFGRNETDVWVQTNKLYSSKPSNNGHFGFSVKIDDNKIVVGAYGENNYQGAVHVFTSGPNSWQKQTVITPHLGKKYDKFGHSISIDKNDLVVGAPFYDTNESNAGCAYTFFDMDGQWVQVVSKAVARQGGDNFWFGYSVVVHSGVVAVGSPNDFTRNGSATLIAVHHTPSKTISPSPNLITNSGSSGSELFHKNCILSFVCFLIMFFNM